MFLLLLFSANAVFACSPGQPDPWYKIDLSFDKTSLPKGVEVVQTDQTDYPYALINHNSEPLYILKENQSIDKYPGSGFPDKYQPLYKIFSDKVYFFSHLDDKWEPNQGEIDNNASRQVNINQNVYESVGGRKQINEDDRPLNVEIPSPQQFNILTYHKGQEHYITGTLIYSLNNNYDPKRGQKNTEACAQFWNTQKKVPIFWIALLIFFPIISFVLLKMIKGSNKGFPNTQFHPRSR